MSCPRTIFAACGLMIVLAACTSTPSPDESNRQATPEVDYPIDTADSKSAQPGKAHRFVLSMHCGIDFAIDFDGAFWEPLDEKDLRRRGDLKTSASRATEEP